MTTATTTIPLEMVVMENGAFWYMFPLCYCIVFPRMMILGIENGLCHEVLVVYAGNGCDCFSKKETVGENIVADGLVVDRSGSN